MRLQTRFSAQPKDGRRNINEFDFAWPLDWGNNRRFKVADLLDGLFCNDGLVNKAKKFRVCEPLLWASGAESFSKNQLRPRQTQQTAVCPSVIGKNLYRNGEILLNCGFRPRMQQKNKMIIEYVYRLVLC